ncbi:MAG TPA: ROK family protein [Blastocatellia bacterium]|nr:ROK family protein [Blastocatellia bacterium]
MQSGPFYLGLDIGGTRVRAALGSGLNVGPTLSDEWPDGLSPESAVGFIADLASGLISESGAAGTVRACGVSLAALTNKQGEVVSWPNHPDWRGLPFESMLGSRLGLPLVIEDDANAAALAEAKLGAGRDYRNLLVMMAGTGVGAGLILRGRLFRGSNGWAGELGHQIVLPGGPECACGHRGCLQLVASGRALERAAAEHGLPGAAALSEAAARGEVFALEALADCGRWLGLAAANVVNLLDLEAVIVGGGLSKLGAPLWPALEGALRTNLLVQSHRSVALHQAALPDDAGVRGAILLAQDACGESGDVSETGRR